MEIKKFQINDGEDARVDVLIASKLDFTRSRIKKLCDDGYVSVNNKVVKANKVLKAGDFVEIILPENKNLDLEPENIPLEIIYQDDDVAVINKPQGMTVHAGSGTNGSTLVGFYVLYAFQNVFDSTFYGLGKTNYMLFESVVTNTLYYGVAFILYITNLWIPTLTGIALLFGIGNAFDSVVSFLVYRYLLKKEKIKHTVFGFFSLLRLCEPFCKLPCPGEAV